MASIWKRSKDKRRKDRPYRISFNSESGKRRTVLGCTDLAKTREIANELESQVRLRARGIIDPAKERCAEQGRRPIGELIDEFENHVKAEGGKAPRYVQQVRRRLESFVSFRNIETLAELNADGVTAFVQHLRERNLGDVTVNEYVGTLKQFSKWAVRTSRLPSDPLAAIKKQSAKTIEKKRPRRALSTDEIGAFLQAAAARPLIELLTIRTGKRKGQPVAKVRPEVRARAEALGAMRVVAYLLALWTGLRRSELRALEWRDVQLDTLPARITLRAATTKAKRSDSVVLHPQIAERLREFRPTDPKPLQRILSAVPGMKVLKADLKYAGIPFETLAGRVDLHAMRKSLATMLAVHGVAQRTAQAHLRHTDPRLTAGVYTDESLLPTAATISALPPLPTTAQPERKEARATGTDGPALDGRADRAAHAQRSGRTNKQNHTSGCNDEMDEGVSTKSSRSKKNPIETGLCASAHRHATKRVMGFEPTTFTLAT